MKKTLISIAALFAVTTAQADTTITSGSGKLTAIIHSLGVTYQINSDDTLQGAAWVSVIDGKQVNRYRNAITGCDVGAGKIGVVDDNGKVDPEQNTWFKDGPSMLDNVAEAICGEMVKTAEKSKLLKPAKKTKL